VTPISKLSPSRFLFVSLLSFASIASLASLAGGCADLPYPPAAEPAPTAEVASSPPVAAMDGGATGNVASAQPPDSSAK
jgi:hypothetical protein